MKQNSIEMAKHLELWAVDRLRPYERNPRTHTEQQVAKIAASIVEFGFTNPILIDDEAGIIAGHGRLLAAKKLKLKEVPVIRLTHLSADQRRALVIADNKLAVEAGWDLEALQSELAALQGAGYDLDLTGFDSDDMRRLSDDLDEMMMRTVATGQSITGPAAEPRTATQTPQPAHGPSEQEPQAEDQEESAEDNGVNTATDYVPFSLIMQPDHRAAVYDAIKVAKERHALDNSGDALFAIIKEWRNS